MYQIVDTLSIVIIVDITQFILFIFNNLVTFKIDVKHTVLCTIIEFVVLTF